jgi:hypothetical protein
MMFMKYLLVLSCIGLIACSAMQKQTQQLETTECMNYRAMMTAPIPPTEHARLKDACERSKQISK